MGFVILRLMIPQIQHNLTVFGGFLIGQLLYQNSRDTIFLLIYTIINYHVRLINQSMI